MNKPKAPRVVETPGWSFNLPTAVILLCSTLLASCVGIAYSQTYKHYNGGGYWGWDTFEVISVEGDKVTCKVTRSVGSDAERDDGIKVFSQKELQRRVEADEFEIVAKPRRKPTNDRPVSYQSAAIQERERQQNRLPRIDWDNLTAAQVESLASGVDVELDPIKLLTKRVDELEVEVTELRKLLEKKQ